jgi:TerC family integral membrane protein
VEETFERSSTFGGLCVVSTVSPEVWVATAIGLVAIVALDLAVIARRQRAVTVADASRWVAFYVGLAIAFGVALYIVGSGSNGSEFAAGYITEYSLSVDNLFVFVIIMSRFGVPAIAEDKVLYIGIVASLVMRGALIGVGAAAISAASWVFYFFGAFLIYTAIRLAREGEAAEPDFSQNPVVRVIGRVIPLGDRYEGAALLTRIEGRRTATPLVIVIAAIGVANVIFALDSIPAIFGLTQDAYIVFTANAFALMGLRQLYFLIGGLLDRIVYLNVGLSVILGFIGVKLVIEALHGSQIDHVGSMHIPDIGILTSLGFIIATLLVTLVVSLRAAGRDQGLETDEA